MSTKKKMLEAAAGAAGGEGLYVEDVFSTYLYTGTGSTQTITNGIDLDGEGGLVWAKRRNGAHEHGLYDTERGTGKRLSTDNTAAEETDANGVTSFNSDGFTHGSADDIGGNSDTYASWTFRKAPKFFDVVTYTGDDVAGRTVSHNLGSVPGCIIIKNLDDVTAWYVYHRSTGNGAYLTLNTTEASASSSIWNNTTPTSTNFTLGSTPVVNGNGNTYVAYLFAHNDGDGEFGESGDQDIIKCGSYTGVSTGVDVNLGWEAQWVLIKKTNSTSEWYIADMMRGMYFDEADPYIKKLEANTSDAEETSGGPVPTATGFRTKGGGTTDNGDTYIYIAIRRPMKTPESGTEVFAMDTLGSTGDGNQPGYRSSFPVDMGLKTSLTGNQRQISTRLLQGTELLTESTAAEAASASKQFDYMNGTDTSTATSSVNMMWMFKRAPGFFDVVAYSGDGVAGRTVSHNLGVAPEMMWVKSRSNASTNWQVYHQATTASDYLVLNGAFASIEDPVFRWYNTAPTDTVFTLGEGTNVNSSGYTYIAYLFATLPGVSKVGSYTGNGTSQTIDCGFSSGARFVLIKRTDSTGDWHVWDTERGIVSGNDPFLELNTTNAENTSYDSVDPASSGFIVNQDAGTNVNVSSATYIYLSIA